MGKENLEWENLNEEELANILSNNLHGGLLNLDFKRSEFDDESIILLTGHQNAFLGFDLASGCAIYSLTTVIENLSKELSDCTPEEVIEFFEYNFPVFEDGATTTPYRHPKYLDDREWRIQEIIQPEDIPGNDSPGNTPPGNDPQDGFPKI